MAAPDPTNEPLYDLGILFVHGIGQSAKAETLLGFGEHLRKCIERLTTDTADVQSRVSIENAKLDPEPGEGPARADLRISNTGRESRWLMAEAWWAGVFPPPAADEIVRWGFKVLPWTLMAHFDRRLRRMGFRTCRAFDGLHPFTEGLPFLLGWAVEAVNVVLALAALPFLMVLLAALWLLGLVPFTPVRDFVRSVQKTLAETIGDSFMLVDQPIVTSAIVGCVREKLEWLAARSRRVAIVAHSQGAAIAHMVLRAPLTAPCDLLITFGSGLAKLSEIKQARDANARRFVLLGMAGATLASACLLLNVVEPWRPFSIWNALTGLLQAVIPVELGVILAFFDLFLTNLDQQSEHEPAPPSWSYVLLYVLPICAFIALVERSWTAWPHVLLNGGFA
ncbi:MAG TPA: hypothetical protein VE621_16845, partial [Bryobacteraceae bacterium]|nr:hypothetical protein [Bryobacteraceae bacterium]